MGKFNLLILISFLLITPLFAEDSKRETIDVLVTTSRGLEGYNDLAVPRSNFASVIDSEELEREPKMDVDDYIRTEPGIGASPSEGNPSYWQEGFTIRGLGAQRVLTLTDGVRQAGQGIGYGGGNLSLYDTFSIDRIEVVRGSGSVLYGTDAYGGVVNVITREPTKRSEYGVNSGFRYVFDGSRDTNRLGSYIDFGDDRAAGLLSFGFVDAGRPNLPDGADPLSGGFRNFGGSAKFDLYLQDGFRFRFLSNMSLSRDVEILDSTIPLPIAIFGRPGSSTVVSSPLKFEFPRYDRYMLGVELNADKGVWGLDSFKSGLYWQVLKREFNRETAFYSLFSPGFAGPPLFVNPRATVTRSVVNTSDRVDTVEWHNVGHVDSMLMGVDLGLDSSDLPETETTQVVARAGVGPNLENITTTSRIRARADQFRAGVYLQDTLTSGNFEFTPGVRGDIYSVDDKESDFDDNELGLSGSLGSVYNLSKQDSLYMTLATGFRAPDLGERFQDGVVNLGVPTRIIGKEDLDAERSYSAEVGSRWEGEKYVVNTAIYANRVNDYIGVTPIGLVNGFQTEQFENIGDVNFYGGEVAVNYKISDGVDIYGNLARTWTTKSDFVDAANWAFNYGAGYRVNFESGVIKAISTQLNLRTVLDSDDNTVTEGREQFDGAGFTVIDLGFNVDLYENSVGDIKLLAGIKNLLDKNYKEPFFNFAQPERSGYIGLQLDF